MPCPGLKAVFGCSFDLAIRRQQWQTVSSVVFASVNFEGCLNNALFAAILRILCKADIARIESITSGPSQSPGHPVRINRQMLLPGFFSLTQAICEAKFLRIFLSPYHFLLSLIRPYGEERPAKRI
ncbi:MAG: hypothetical protein CMN76_10820 [Spirochaetaceae bacterium]|nr:hypothetical protein [Spirochaetaceae bacterium]